jgi:hypothetical protein
MKLDNIALDTNILIYLHDASNDRKRKLAETLLACNPKIPAQVTYQSILTLPGESLIYPKPGCFYNLLSYLTIAKSYQ